MDVRGEQRFERIERRLLTVTAYPIFKLVFLTAGTFDHS